MQQANYFLNAPLNIIDETALMSRKMHMRWNDFDRQQMAHKMTNNKSFNVEYDMTNLHVANNDKSIKSDIYQAMFPIYHISKLLGVFPMRFVRQVSGRYQGRLSIIDSVYSLFLLTCLIGTAIWGFWHDCRNGSEYSTRLKSKIAIVVSSSDMLGLISLTSASIIGSILCWQHVRSVIDKLIECDEIMGILSPKKLQRCTVLLTLSSLCYTIFMSCFDVYTWTYEINLNKRKYTSGSFNYLPLDLMYIVIIMMEIQYAIIVCNVGQRFLRVNMSLENILKSKITNQFRNLGLAGDLRDDGQLITCIQQEMVGNTRMFRKSKIMDSSVANDNMSFTDRISRLLIVHASLCDSVSLINSAYGVVVLLITISCLIHLIVAPSFLITESDRMHDPLFLTLELLWCVFHILRLLMIVQPTYATTIQAKKTAVLVSQLLFASHNSECTKLLEIFSLQLLHRPVEFSACGFFTLNRTVVTSIIGAVTTYLVILVQFQKDDEAKGSYDNILKNATLMLKNATTLHNFTGGKLSL